MKNYLSTLSRFFLSLILLSTYSNYTLQLNGDIYADKEHALDITGKMLGIENDLRRLEDDAQKAIEQKLNLSFEEESAYKKLLNKMQQDTYHLIQEKQPNVIHSLAGSNVYPIATRVLLRCGVNPESINLEKLSLTSIPMTGMYCLNFAYPYERKSPFSIYESRITDYSFTHHTIKLLDSTTLLSRLHSIFIKGVLHNRYWDIAHEATHLLENHLQKQSFFKRLSTIKNTDIKNELDEYIKTHERNADLLMFLKDKLLAKIAIKWLKANKFERNDSLYMTHKELMSWIDRIEGAMKENKKKEKKLIAQGPIVYWQKTQEITRRNYQNRFNPYNIR